MTWNTGTATDYIDLLDQLIAISTSRNVSAAAVNNGGSSYAIDDILTVAGGTSSHVATLRVTSVSSGVIDGIRVETGGAYTVDPTTTANAVTGGSGTGATIDLTMADTGWTLRRRTQEAASATPNAGGSGYTNGDLLTVSGGLLGHGGVAAVFQATVTAGAVTGLTLITAGNYEEVPSNPVSVTGGTGTGATLDVTWQYPTSQDQVVILEGEGLAGADSIFVGIKTWQGTNITASATTFNWALFGMTTFNSALKFHEQTNLSPGLNATTGAITSSNNVGAFVPLKDADAFDISFWVSVTGRRILGVGRTDTAALTRYMGFHLGFLNQLGVTNEFPYPLYIAGATNRKTGWYQDTAGVVSGLMEVVGLTGGSGPAYVWDPNGSWVSVRNATVSTDTTLNVTAASSDNWVYPAGRPTPAVATEDKIVDNGAAFDWADVIFVDGAGAVFVYPMPGDDRLLVPAFVMRTDVTASPDAFVQMGEVDGLSWVSAANGESAEDEIIKADFSRHMMFYGGNRTTSYSYLAVRED